MPMLDGTQTPEERQRAARNRTAPGDYVNFQRRFAANRDVAQREANKYATQAQGAVNTAQQATKAAQAKFEQGMQAGTVPAAPPTNTGAGAQQAQQPPQAVQAYPAAQLAPTPQAGASAGALESESTRPAASNSAALTGESTRPEGSGGDADIAGMLAKAGQKYTGPEGLEGPENDAAIDAAKKAQERLGLIGSNVGIQTLVNESGRSGSRGADILSGSLIGSAGRKSFDALRSRFNPNKELQDAQKSAVEQAKRARETSETNAKGWGEAATQAKTAKDARDKEIKEVTDRLDKEAAANRANTKKQVPYARRNDPLAYSDGTPEGDKREQEEYARFQRAQAKDWRDDLRSVVRDMSAVDKLWNLTDGGKSPLDKMGSDFNANFHKNDDSVTKTGVAGGNESGGIGEHIYWSPDDYPVWRQMDDAQWGQLRSLGKDQQIRWIKKRLQELQPNWGAESQPGYTPPPTQRAASSRSG